MKAKKKIYFVNNFYETIKGLVQMLFLKLSLILFCNLFVSCSL